MEKPKVRFSHSSENAVGEAILRKGNNVKEKRKVKVKSIVPVNLPIKVLKSGKRLLLKANENVQDVEVITEQILSKKSHSQHAHVKNHFSKSNVTIPSHTCAYKIADNCAVVNSKQMSRPEMPISETPANYLHLTLDKLDQSNGHDLKVQNCTEKLQGITIRETNEECFTASSMDKDQLCQKTTNSNCTVPTEIDCVSSDHDEDAEIQIINVINRTQFQQVSKNKDKSDNQVHSLRFAARHEDKENKENFDLYKTSHKKRSTKTSDTLKDATCSSYNNDKPSAKNPVRTSRKLQVMPCAKFKLATSVNKQAKKETESHVRTRSLFNIAGKASNILVLPEIPKVSYNEYVKYNPKKSYENRDITSKNLLTQPEYNSTVCVIKKLKEIEEEKLIKDIESLPATYKSLVHGKISAALNFAPFESVYKNLINLSVDDNELPARLTRTKDPEPRNRDMIPNLDKFYNPKSTQEHFMSLHPQIFVPICVNTLNAFTISNKICTWRISRDSF